MVHRKSPGLPTDADDDEHGIPQSMSIQIDRLHPLQLVHTTPPSDDRQSQMEQALKRSVTLVIWYRSKCDPIRLTHEISTFPLFSLSHYPSVVSDLELTSGSYIDAYNGATGHWEQHLITTVRTIESEQRLLYKLRKSLFAGLADDECTGLADELTLQAKKKQAQPTTPSHLKRALPDAPEAPCAKRLYFPDSYPHVYIPPPMGYMLPTQTLPYAPPLATSPLPTHAPARSTAEPGDSPPVGLASASTPPPLYSPNTAGARTPFPQPHPPLKRWPNDYTVAEIAAGFRAMDAMVAASPSATQKAAFERVFGCRYVKSTVCRHRGVYRKAEVSVRSLFEAMGPDERAVWGEFVRRVEGRAAASGAGRGSGDEKEGAGEGSGGAGPSRQGGEEGQDAMIAQMSHMTMQVSDA